MVRGKHFDHSVFLWIYFTTHLFSLILSTFPMLAHVGGFSPHPVNMFFQQSHSSALSSDLLRLSVLWHNSQIPFLLHFHWVTLCRMLDHFSGSTIQGFRFTLVNDSFISSGYSQIPWSCFIYSTVYLLSYYLYCMSISITTDPNNTSQILCRLLVDVISP